MFCRNCGKELAPSAGVCLSCGVVPPTGSSYCQNCGNMVSPLAEICVKCGVRLALSSSKNRTVSIILAVFLGYWTWLYTYGKDSTKFWIGLGLFLVFTIPSRWAFVTVTTIEYDVSFISGLIAFIWLFIGWIGAFGIWLWAVINTLIKPQDWYNHYSVKTKLQ